MKEHTIVSLADSNYFELLCELIDSIKSFEESKTGLFETKTDLFNFLSEVSDDALHNYFS